MKRPRKSILSNSSGFIVADFIFSFVLVIGCGIIIFALTFSLTTIEIIQYITWSSARAYSAGNLSESASRSAANQKYKNLTNTFPLLTGAAGANSPWFIVSPTPEVGVLATSFKGADVNNAMTGSPEPRQPWIGVGTKLELKLFKSLQIPLIGKLATDPDIFTFPIRTFILRHPSQDECLKFFKRENRFELGIKTLESNWSNQGFLGDPNSQYRGIEDNGC